MRVKMYFYLFIQIEIMLFIFITGYSRNVLVYKLSKMKTIRYTSAQITNNIKVKMLTIYQNLCTLQAVNSINIPNPKW